MGRLVLALAVVLGLTALHHATRPARPRLYGRTTDAFPFPTAEGREGIDVDDPASVATWCGEFDCTEEQLRAAVRQHGSEPHAVARHLDRKR